MLHVGQHGIWWGGFKKTNGMGGTLAHKSEWCFWTIWTIWTIWDSCSMFFPQVLFFFFFLLCVLYIGFYAWAWAQLFPISSKYLWFLGKKLHELGKIVNNCNLETYRGIKINNLRADSILVQLYHYCGKESYIQAEILTIDIQGHKLLRWNHTTIISI